MTEVPGFARGLALIGPYAFVGLSKIRETSAMDGVPLAERRIQLKCGVAVVDLDSGTLRGTFEFCSGVDEIFDVAVMPGIRELAIRGPSAAEDGQEPIWVVPPPQAP